MSDVSISVLGNPEASNGGEAIIRITGIGLVPPGSTFRIEPLDEDQSAEVREGWPSGELRPRSQRIISDGVELLVGPEVVDAPALLPGTPVAITIPAVQARTELRWPLLEISRAPRRSAVILSGEQRAAEIAAKAEAQRKAAQLAAATAAAEAVKAKAAEAAVRAAETAVRAAVEGNPVRAGTPAGDVPPLAVLSSTVGTTRVAGSPAPPTPAKPREIKALTARGAAVPAAAAPPPPTLSRSAPPPPAPLRAGTAGSLPPPRSAGGGVIGKLVAFGLGCLAATAAVLAIGGLGKKPPEPISRLVSQADTPGGLGTVSKLSAILEVAPVSPLGQSGSGTSLAEALRRADAQLNSADDQRNREEARYWLRKALALGLGDERMQWAMTQLGTLYATPGAGAPDYQSARVLWELAAAKGDPVAYCFLASLYEHGLGLPADRGAALALYRGAKQKGGCRHVDEAIERLGRGTR